MIPYSLIVPDWALEELMVIRDTGSRLSWRLGDIVTLVMEWNQANENPVGIMDVYSAVGSVAGYSSRSIRDYHSVAAFYMPEVRNDPAYQILSFAHFRAAMVLGPDWQTALDWAIEQVDELNRPATVDAVMAKFMVAPAAPDVPSDLTDDTEPGDDSLDDEPTDDPGNQVPRGCAGDPAQLRQAGPTTGQHGSGRRGAECAGEFVDIYCNVTVYAVK